ncbi:MAG: galactokinase [Paludibacteraceae bacterium]|nr:galactokinase [Paludibacteraceae bacterium]
MEKGLVIKYFNERFGSEKCSVYVSPGRINLIGEHTDYNGGFVFPGAVEQCIVAAIAPNGTNRVRAYSIDLTDYAEWEVDDKDGPDATCFRFVYGVARELTDRGVLIKGFDTVFAGDVPLGAGMSSSAALESCFAFGLNDLFADGNSVSKWDMVLAGQATEHKYIGTNCGIMDQFASVFGKKGQLMRLDCRSHEFEYFPFNPEGYRLVLVNSCVKHELAGSPYNDRRRSCERVAAAIQQLYTERKIETLRDCTWEDIEAVKSNCTAEDIRRATFVLGEKDRVLTVCDALVKGDYEKVGKQMYLTHTGLSRDYEVSCEELDYLNEVARECGVTGSRIMGGGFGGCTINLVKNGLYNDFVQTVTRRYKEKYNITPQIIDVIIGDGSRKLQ